MYDEISLNESIELTNDWTDEEKLSLNVLVPQHGLKTKFRNHTLLEISKKLLKISEDGLIRRNNLSSNKKYDEAYYLLSIKENIKNGESPADYLLKKYEGSWKNSIKPIYEELIF